MDWFQTGKGVHQGCILSSCLFNLYAEYIMRNTGLEETQAGIKIAGRNINHLRYIDDTTLMAESEEELKSLLTNVKEVSEKGGLKTQYSKAKIMTSDPITSWQIDGETMEIVRDFIFLGSEITEMVTETLKLKDTYSLEESYGQPRQHIKKKTYHFPNKDAYSQSYGFSSSHIQM